jgi:hypothetical protein
LTAFDAQEATGYRNVVCPVHLQFVIAPTTQVGTTITKFDVPFGRVDTGSVEFVLENNLPFDDGSDEFTCRYFIANATASS